jgi:hypothetical protein
MLQTHYKFVTNWNIYKEINKKITVEHNNFQKSYVRWSFVYFLLSAHNGKRNFKIEILMSMFDIIDWNKC